MSFPIFSGRTRCPESLIWCSVQHLHPARSSGDGAKIKHVNREHPMMRIAVLYPGAMGRALAEMLIAFHPNVVSHLAERGVNTVSNARAAGIVDMPCFQELVNTSEIVVSLVPPSA